MIAESNPELWLATASMPPLLLTGETVTPAGASFTIEALSEDATWANPVPVDVSVQRWMTDGAVTITQGHEDREPFFKVVVSAETSADLAAGEAELALRATQPATLTWISPEGESSAPASVFEVWTWHLEHVLDDEDELELQRMYGLRFTAKPWTRSEDLVQEIAAVVPATTSTALIDACNAVTGWTGSPNTPALVTGGGAVVESMVNRPAGSIQTYLMSLTRTGPVTMTKAFLLLDMVAAGSTFAGSKITSVLVDGKALTKRASLGTQSWWSMPSGTTSFTTLLVSASHTVQAFLTGVQLSLTVSDVSQTNTLGGIGSTKQLFRTLDIKGSVPTSGSLKVASPGSGGLGNVLVYTCQDDGSGYVPAMSRYRTAGNTDTIESDPTAVTGQRERLERNGLTGSGFFFTATIPANQLSEATYAVLARLKCAVSGRQPIVVSASQASRTLNVQTRSWVNFATADVWQWAPIGLLALPPSPVPGGSTVPTKVIIAPDFLAAGYSAQAVWLDELYLMDVTNGAWTLLNAETSTRLWLDAPDVDMARNRNIAYLGSADDRSDAVGAGYWVEQSLGDHDLYPGSTVLFSATDGVAGAQVSASYYPRWHTHAGL